MSYYASSDAPHNRKMSPASRTSSETHPKHISSPIEERRRIAKWLKDKAEDKNCMKNVKFTPKES